jgi:hypothetical protein
MKNSNIDKDQSVANTIKRWNKGYTEYGYRGAEEVKRLHEEIKLLKEVVKLMKEAQVLREDKRGLERHNKSLKNLP